MIYDCFTFFNELDLLEIRLNVLNDVVDRFVLVEATKAHSGKDKPLYFNDNKERYKAFQHKIIHVIVDEYPVCTSPWAYENHQRNAILRGLAQAQPDDAIMISDLDEIPQPDLVRLYAKTETVILFIQKLYYYYLNYLNVSSPDWPLGTKLFPYRYFLGDDSKIKAPYSEFLLPELNQGVTPTKMRFVENVTVIRSAGWHFSYLGGTEAIIKKIQSTAHQEFNKEKNTDPKEILAQISSGKDIFGRGDRFFGVPINDDYPQYIRENQQKFQHLIFGVTAEYLQKTWLSRRYYASKGALYRFLVFRVIPRSLHPLLIRIRNLLWFGQTTVPRPDVETDASKR
jgi:beta-1,4-mannosyl-glycoprotein beta-1,4-N-acetylglucosaminyltransferase